jgi:hypothetical protein
VDSSRFKTTFENEQEGSKRCLYFINVQYTFLNYKQWKNRKIYFIALIYFRIKILPKRLAIPAAESVGHSELRNLLQGME